MNKIIFSSMFLLFFEFLQSSIPADFWNGYTQKEKIAFINGVYGTVAKIKAHHKTEVRKQFIYDDNWVEPYYIERFYEIADEYLSEEVGYNINIIAMHMDAFYSNSDNYNIPVLEALRVVSLIQDGQKKTANLRLLRAQKKYEKD
ncbi:MAG: hypothetical protein CMG60_02150 [Candidatus Marinimicrobia bacterium]|nr:hypothetical protein [Candidatus Neomarinimicrobiota bacterium]